ncbi:MAG TPA: VWA domain-containing protein [Kofleriaceae bacterium]|nr:VWA domain-containing protein [Kofleriaceae bacterium]
MLIDFFYELRRQGVDVSAHEWLTLMEALDLGLHDSSLDGFYRVARAVCVKEVGQLDAFDLAFLAHFRGVRFEAMAITSELIDWLSDPRMLEGLSEEERRMIERLDLDELRRRFEERLREQERRHDGGNRWIGTGGKSPFGNSGAHPTGMRVGGEGGGRSAMQLASERRFREYRRDAILDVRQIDLALRRLRRLGRDGAPVELDLDETISATARNAGELELVFHPPKRNRMKLILLMDVGGSMEPHARLVERLFTAASRVGRFASFRHYYFHNCVYDEVYEDADFRQPLPLADLIAESSRDERLVVVGDALMHPAELLSAGGALYYHRDNRSPGIASLHRMADWFRRVAWLNPEPERFWPRSTAEVIASVFPMWTLTLDGLDRAVRYLIGGAERPHTA